MHFVVFFRTTALALSRLKERSQTLRHAFHHDRSESEGTSAQKAGAGKDNLAQEQTQVGSSGFLSRGEGVEDATTGGRKGRFD